MRILVMGAMVLTALPLTTPLLAQERAGVSRSADSSNWPNGRRWGYRFNGRWIGGSRAPGGWAAYRPAVRGWAMPSYWTAPRFRVADFGSYGLSAPPAGHGWVRYYDDAVLVDPYGRVRDSVRGVDWGDAGDDWVDIDEDYREDRYAQGYYDRDPAERAARQDDRVGAPYPMPDEPVRQVYAQPREVAQPLPGQAPARRYADRGQRGAPYPLPEAGDRRPYAYAPPTEVARPAPPRGPRYADRYEDRGAPYPMLPEDADRYDPPPVRYADGYGDPYRGDPGREVRNPDGSTTVYHADGTTVTTTEGYEEDGWYYPPTTTTVTTVTSPPVVRTTVTEEYVPVRRGPRRRR